MSSTEVKPQIQPFTVDVPQADIDDVLDRLARARWTDEIEGSETSYGVPLARVRELADHWRTSFDWRAVEARLNAYPQFTTTIDGQNVHFIHARSGREGGFPLILTHGWPGSVLEYLDVIEPLTEAGFDLVIPSIPGYGFSGPTTESGWDNVRIARAWVELMSRLGYERYGAMGNDAGSMISPEVGRLDPEHCIGVHVTQLFSFPTGDPSEMEDLTEDERAALDVLTWFWENIGAFNVLQSQAPQTLAFGLADSPVALLGVELPTHARPGRRLPRRQRGDLLVHRHGRFLDPALPREPLGPASAGRPHHRADRPLVVGQRLPLDPAVRGAGPLRHPQVAAA